MCIVVIRWSWFCRVISATLARGFEPQFHIYPLLIAIVGAFIKYSTGIGEHGSERTGNEKARTEAGNFLGNSPPKWHTLGFDEQRERFKDFLQHLLNTKSSTVADKFESNEDLTLEFLRTRTKTIRNKKETKPISSAALLV